MVVRTQYDGFRVSGLYVGVRNVRRYFSKRNPVVELQLDHLQIQCGLAPRFWEGQPEIHDPRLSVWLESKYLHKKPSKTPVLLTMVPSGNNCFRIQPTLARGESRRPKLASALPPAVQPA